jgi:hypothetical protein
VTRYSRILVAWPPHSPSQSLPFAFMFPIWLSGLLLSVLCVQQILYTVSLWAYVCFRWPSKARAWCCSHSHQRWSCLKSTPRSALLLKSYVDILLTWNRQPLFKFQKGLTDAFWKEHCRMKILFLPLQHLIVLVHRIHSFRVYQCLNTLSLFGFAEPPPCTLFLLNLFS